MLEIGRLCIKTAGRDAMRHCIILEEIDKNYVLVDGNTRRKKVNKNHLELLDKVFKVDNKTTTKQILEILKKEGIKILKSEVKKEVKVKKPQIKKVIAKKSKIKKAKVKK